MDPIATTMFKFYAPTLIASRGSDGEMRIEGVASSTVRDYHGDQITEKALRKMAKSALGMTIFLNHSYNVPDDIFGAVEKARVVKTAEVDERTGQPIYDMRVGIVVQKINPIAVRTFEVLESKKADGTQKTKLGLSIGAMVSEGGATFDKSAGGRYIVDDLDIVETSIVSMPANPRSFIDYAVKGISGFFPEKLDSKRIQLVKEMNVSDDGELESSAADDVDALTPDPQEAEADPDGEERTQVGETLGEGETGEITDEGPFEAQTVTDEDRAAAAPAHESPIGEPDPGVTEEIPVEKTRVSVWESDEGKTIEVDTGRSRAKAGDGDQSAQDGDVAETAGGSKTTKAELDSPLVKSLTGQLAALKASSQAETARLTGERDAALALAAGTLEQAQGVLKALESKPVGRKTTAGQFEDKDIEKARVDLDSLAGIYGDDVMKILKRKG